MLSNYNKTSYFSLRVTEPIPPSCFIEMCYKWTQFPYSLCFRTVHYLRSTIEKQQHSTGWTGAGQRKVVRTSKKLNDKESVYVFVIHV